MAHGKEGVLSEDGILNLEVFGTYAVQVEFEGVWFEGTFAHEKETKDVQRVELRDGNQMEDWIKKKVLSMKICVAGLVRELRY